MNRVIQFFHRLRRDYAFRTTLFSGVSFTINLFYAALQAVLAGIFGSLWYSSLAVYYGMLCGVRGCTIFFERRVGKHAGESKLKKSLKYYFFSGIMLLILNGALIVLVSYMVVTGTSSTYSMIPAIASAAYAFYKFILAIINAVKAKKYDDYVIRALRNITLVDAVVSMFALATAMTETFGDGVRGSLFPMIVTLGFAAIAVCLVIALYMAVFSALKLKKLSHNEAGGPDEE